MITKPSGAILLGLTLVLLALIGGVVVSESLVGDGEATSDAHFRNVSGEVGVEYEATKPGTPTGAAGVYVADFDRDGYPDLLLLGGKNSTGLFPDGPILFENTGDGFTPSNELPREAFDKHVVESALFFDYDNDGWQDLLLLRRGGEPVFLENRRGNFRVQDVGLNATLARPMGATTADYNGDGCLDLFIYQNGEWNDRIPDGMDMTIRGEGNVTITDDNGNPNLLYRGDCTSFTNVTQRANISGSRWSLAASFVDLAGDGRPDIHVGNDYNYDYIYINQGNGTFSQRRLSEATDRNAMSSEVADINQDGKPDIFVTNIYIDTSNLTEPQRNFIENRIGDRVEGNNLLINKGDGRFVDRAKSYNVHKGGWGWAASIADFDNDGDSDIFHLTEELEVYYNGTVDTSFAIYPVFRERTDSGYQLRDPEKLGFEPMDGRGVARLDYNRDGQLDLAVSTYAVREQYPFYRNTGAEGNWFEVQVRGAPEQTAIGSDVYLTVDGKTYHQQKTARVDFLSQETRIIHFGIGNQTRIDSLRIVWPNGTERKFTDLDANQRVAVAPNGDFERDRTDAESGSIIAELADTVRALLDQITEEIGQI